MTTAMPNHPTQRRDKLLTLGIVSDCASHIVTRGVKNVTTLPLGIITPHVG